MHNKKANHNFGVATKSSFESEDLSKLHENAARPKKSVVFSAIFLKMYALSQPDFWKFHI